MKPNPPSHCPSATDWKPGRAREETRHARQGSITSLLVAALIVGIVGIGWFALNWGAPAGTANPATRPNRPAAAQSDASETTTPSAKELFEVSIRKPNGPPSVLTGLNDESGHPITVACGTCHATRNPNFNNKRPSDLDEFHSKIKVTHGTISCLSCHNSNDYDALQLADRSRVEFSNVMILCAQCHGPQMKDFEHGAHGGMNGHWDLTQGPRSRNNCVDCHDPHSPQFPHMQPTFKPRDRFLEKSNH